MLASMHLNGDGTYMAEGEKERKKENQFHILFIPSKSASIGVQNTLK
jgi:hypothetical protein